MTCMDCAGAGAFGLVVGWITYRTLRRKDGTGLSDIATVLGVIGGATVTGLFPREGGAFSCYAIGVAVGFFAYLICSAFVPEKLAAWMGEAPPMSRGSGGQTPPRVDP
jgi:hypothetical protein